MAKILVIDDEKIIRDQMKKLLDLDDYETFTAEDGQTGLKIYDQEQPDIALVDVKMPGMSGIEVLKRMKERSTATEVIIITGHGGVETAIEALKLGAFSYLQKPLEYDELEIEIKRALEKQEMKKQLDKHVLSLESAYSELEQIFNTAVDGMWVIDKNANVLRVNDRFQTLSGFSAGEAVGKKCYEVFPSAVCRTSECCMVRIRGGEKHVQYEIDKKCKDGSKVPCLLSIVPYMASNGELIGMVQNIEDMTERKRAAAEMKKAHDQLESLYARLQREHEIAKQVFAKVIRTDYIEFPNMKYLLWPMEIVSGDLLLVAPKSPDGMYIFLGDFTGHGLSAAIGAIPVTDVFYAMTAKNASIADIVAEINSKLKAVLPTGIFCCACLMELDHDSGELTVWNGGMPDVFVVKKQGGLKHRLPFHAPALGVVGSDELELDTEIIELAPGDRVYAYSDGVTELCAHNGEKFGGQRLEECLIREFAGDNILDNLGNSLKGFRQDAPQSDDITIIELTYGQEGPMVWKMTFTFDAGNLRTTDVASYLREMIEKDQWLREHKYDLNIILSELLVNALDWGVLGLDSSMKNDPEGFEQYVALRQRRLDALTEGWIKVDLALSGHNKGGELVIRVRDSGSGFDYSKPPPQFSDNTSFSRRGIQLVRSLCQKFSYQGRGNRVEAVYVWS